MKNLHRSVLLKGVPMHVSVDTIVKCIREQFGVVVEQVVLHQDTYYAVPP